MRAPLSAPPPAKVRDTFLVFGQPRIREAEIAEVAGSMRKAWLGTGPKVSQFERDFAAFKGVSQAVALNSCTAALHLSLLALDLKPGDEIVTTPLTFCATVNSILHAGGIPVLADVDAKTMNLDPEQVRRKMSPRVKAILPVHFAGRACDMEGLVSTAEEHGAALIEDCAHAIETEYRGRKAVTF